MIRLRRTSQRAVKARDPMVIVVLIIRNRSPLYHRTRSSTPLSSVVQKLIGTERFGTYILAGEWYVTFRDCETPPDPFPPLYRSRAVSGTVVQLGAYVELQHTAAQKSQSRKVSKTEHPFDELLHHLRKDSQLTYQSDRQNNHRAEIDRRWPYLNICDRNKSLRLIN